VAQSKDAAGDLSEPGKNKRERVKRPSAEGLSSIGQYTLAAVIALIALLLRLALVPLIGGQAPFITLYPAVALIAMLAGFWPAMFICVLGTLAAEYFVVLPVGIELDISTVVRVAVTIFGSSLVAMLGEKMRRSQKQARDKASQLERLTDKLDAKTKDLEAIITVVSHDLRAPLMNVRGFGKEIGKDCQTIRKLLSDVSMPDQSKKQVINLFEQSIPESLNFIEASAEAMNNLAVSLVKVARAGLAVPSPETLDMNQLVKNVSDSIRIKFKDTGATINIDDLPACFADKMHATQIFTNLMDNAVKYLDPNRPGQIHVSGSIEKDCAVYCVSDNGIGIAPEYKEKVFEIFYRLAEKAGAGGEGIGLAMVKRMVDRDNGRIWLVSDKGKGCKFFIALPLSPPSKDIAHL
jgi:signal transduction histidine kinase